VQVKVADRSVFKTTDAETKVAFPSLLQAAIDAAVGEYLQKLSKVVMQPFLSPIRTNQVAPIRLLGCYVPLTSWQSAIVLCARIRKVPNKELGFQVW